MSLEFKLERTDDDLEAVQLKKLYFNTPQEMMKDANIPKQNNDYLLKVAQGEIISFSQNNYLERKVEIGSKEFNNYIGNNGQIVPLQQKPYQRDYYSPQNNLSGSYIN